MKKVTLISLAFIFASLSITSCQKAKEPEEKKEGQVEKKEAPQIQKEGVEQKLSEFKPQLKAEKEWLQKAKEAEPEVKPKKEQPSVKPEEKGDKKEKPQETKPSPLTEEEQKFVEDITPNNFDFLKDAFKSEKKAIKYLKILLKGDEKTIRLFQEMGGAADMGPEERRKFFYGEAIATTISVINPTKKENFELFIRVLEEKKDYPEAMSEAAKILKFAKDKSVMPLLHEITKHPDPRVRLEAAGALLFKDYGDVALPVLDELTVKEGYTGSLYYLFSGPGKIIDERGYAIVEKALSNPKAEVRIHATKIMLDSKKITKEKAEEIALEIVEELKDKTLKDYGLALKPGGIYDIIPLPGSTVDFKKAEAQAHSDGRACEYTINMLGDFKSKRSIPLLKHIHEKNTRVEYVCQENLSHAYGPPVERILKSILENGDGK